VCGSEAAAHNFIPPLSNAEEGFSLCFIFYSSVKRYGALTRTAEAQLLSQFSIVYDAGTLGRLSL
jgi:hypothetical protein